MIKVYRVIAIDDKVSDATKEYEKETEHYFINGIDKDKKITGFSCMSTDKKACEDWLILHLENKIISYIKQISNAEKSIILFRERIQGVKDENR